MGSCSPPEPSRYLFAPKIECLPSSRQQRKREKGYRGRDELALVRVAPRSFIGQLLSGSDKKAHGSAGVGSPRSQRLSGIGFTLGLGQVVELSGGRERKRGLGHGRLEPLLRRCEGRAA